MYADFTALNIRKIHENSGFQSVGLRACDEKYIVVWVKF